MSNEERARLKEEVQQFSMGDISQFMEALPRDFLMVLRTEYVVTMQLVLQHKVCRAVDAVDLLDGYDAM